MKALIIVDVQNDFCEGGSLEVKNSNEIFPFINNLLRREEFSTIFISKDWHQINHTSFAVNHGKNPFETIIDEDGNERCLWPVHCIQNTYGSQLHKELEIQDIEFVQVLKGYIQTEECYSAFGTKKHPTELETLLNERQIKDVVVVGLALDYCVGSTAMDAKRAGFNVSVIEEATRPVGLETGKAMIDKLQKNGIFYKSFKQFSQFSSITNDSGDQSSSQQN